jgi:uncharacterized protein YlaN (UPF0358 family)
MNNTPIFEEQLDIFFFSLSRIVFLTVKINDENVGKQGMKKPIHEKTLHRS